MDRYAANELSQRTVQEHTKVSQTPIKIKQSLIITRLAEELYSSKFRLIYELLQNADDATHDLHPEPAVVIFPNFSCQSGGRYQ